MSDIFISYATADREFAREIAQALSGYGWSVWWDREIPFGQSFDRVIERELANARSVIVLWSATSVDSDWVRNEARRGLSRSVLIPARIEEVDLPLEFSNVQTADLTDWKPDQPHPAFDKLVARLRIVLGEAAQPEALPTAPPPSPAMQRAAAISDAEHPKRPSRMAWIAAAAALIAALGGLGYWLSGTRSLVEMPDLIGESADAAAAVIAANGLELAPVARVETEEARPGMVIDQSPRPGTRLKRGTAVELAVAGEPTRAVPALAGTTPAAAERRLREVGLRIGQVITKASPDARPGTIISQSPAADSRVPKNSGVDIVVAAPPPTRSVEAGPIWSQDDAKKKCPAVCAKANGGWTGHWWTTVEGKMSVCQCAF